MNVVKQIFKGGSTTYYLSSVLFPKSKREDVGKLYSFVRVIDDYVDPIEPDITHFKETKKLWEIGKRDARGAKTKNHLSARVVSNILYLSELYKFKAVWVRAYFKAMQMDLNNHRFKTLDDTLEYLYGSTEVVGLMVAKIMGLGPKAQEAARLQGRAIQYLNFIRDIAEDNKLGRCYFPQKELRKFGLNDLSEKTARAKPDKFAAFISHQIIRYGEWQAQADQKMAFMPRRLRIPMKTAAQTYGWTAEQIARNPMVVFSHRVKPSRWRFLRAGVSQLVLA